MPDALDSGSSDPALLSECLVLLDRLAKAGVRPVHQLNPHAARRLGMRLYDLDRQQEDMRLLRRLLRLGQVSAEQLAAAMVLPMAAVLLSLERLHESGVVMRHERQPGSFTWSTRLSMQRRRLQSRMVLDRLAALDHPVLPSQNPRARLTTRNLTLARGLQARLYLPPSPAPGSPLPVVLFAHGGGWVIGSIETHDSLCRDLSQRSGCAFLSVEYRLAPEHPWPAAPDDLHQALLWLLRHGGDLGLRVERLALMGDSAGGNLAAVTAMAARDHSLVQPELLVLVCPVLDATMSLPSWEQHALAPFLSAADMRWFYSHYNPDPTHWRGSPLQGELKGLPPALVITASHDPVRDEGQQFAAMLQAEGGTALLRNYPGTFHDFVLFSPAISAANQARDEIAAFLSHGLMKAMQ